MVKVDVKNIDLAPNDLFDFYKMVESIMMRDIDPSSKDLKTMRDIIDILSVYNIFLEIYDLNMMEFQVLNSIKELKFNIIRTKVEYGNLNTENEELRNEYHRLTEQCKSIIHRLDHDVSPMSLEFIEPNSKLLDVSISLSIKELMEILCLCLKYDEMLHFIVGVSNNELMEVLISFTNLIKDLGILNTEEVYMRYQLDEGKRELLSGGVPMVLTDEEFVKKLVNEDNYYDLKVSMLVSLSNVAVRNIKKPYRNLNIKMENPKYIKVEECYNNLVLPVDFLSLDDYTFNELDKYVYDWFVLTQKLLEEENMYDINICKLGCCKNIVNINGTVFDYDKLSMSDGPESELDGVLSILDNIIQ